MNLANWRNRLSEAASTVSVTINTFQTCDVTERLNGNVLNPAPRLGRWGRRNYCRRLRAPTGALRFRIDDFFGRVWYPGQQTFN